MSNKLFYGDNLPLMDKYIDNNSIDLCYIDPPFNSKRDYFQIYQGIDDQEDFAQAQAFEDTWEWGDSSSNEYEAIMSGRRECTRETTDLLQGLHGVLGERGLLAYLISMTTRLNKIYQCLKPSGSFFLHCDPTAGHYLKLILDSIYIPRGGDFRNEIIWGYRTGGVSKRWFAKKHDTIFYYVKDRNQFTFNPIQEEVHYEKPFFMGDHQPNAKGQYVVPVYVRDVWDSGANPNDRELKPVINLSKERLGYPTQKPIGLLSRIIKASTNKNDTVMDCYCGCGTTIDAADMLNRKWIGMDVTYHAISIVLRRLKIKKSYNLDQIEIHGIPKDLESAKALSTKKDDYQRKEFEIWSILHFSCDSGIPNLKKGGDAGSDGIVYFYVSPTKMEKASLEVKSSKTITHAMVDRVESGMKERGASLGYLITLYKPSKGIYQHASKKGYYVHPLFPKKKIPRIQIVTIEEMLQGRTIDKMGIQPIATTPEGKPLSTAITEFDFE